MYHGTIYSVPRYWTEVMGLVWGPAGCRRQKGPGMTWEQLPKKFILWKLVDEVVYFQL